MRVRILAWEVLRDGELECGGVGGVSRTGDPRKVMGLVKVELMEGGDVLVGLSWKVYRVGFVFDFFLPAFASCPFLSRGF